MSSRKGAEIIVDYLVRQGVPYAFGMCGHGDIGLLGARYDRRGGRRRPGRPAW